VAYTSFLNSLKGDHFKFALAEQKETTLTEALRMATNFIRATQICANNSDAPKKAKVSGDKNFNHSDRNPDSREKRPPFEVVDPRFTTDARSILIEVRGHPML